ncbi:MAG: penicillin acylase family protein [Bacteroidota bacterium]|nr:penicillin acylase family protein [Rhodothermia bacterium]MDW8284735.1 penicillin acylase family protein [Bacteroidota bacterium]
MTRLYLRLSARLLLLAACSWALTLRWGSLPPPELFLDPWDGLYRTARAAREPKRLKLSLPGLSRPVLIVRDARGVPHLFAQEDRDLALALGYVVARDRLFQMDLLARTAAGRLAEVLGPAFLERDRDFRRTGMAWAARRAAERLRQEKGIDWMLLEAFSQGVNAYVSRLRPQDYPLEFRLLGYRPELWSPERSLLIALLQAFELTFRLDDLAMSQLAERLGQEAVRELYPQHSPIAEPFASGPGQRPPSRVQPSFIGIGEGLVRSEQLDLGSNHWAVSGARSKSGLPLLAGDPHLRLTLPSIWYEVHLVSPTRNIYGVTIPGTPAVVIGFNDYVAWTFTNTGADVLDVYALRLDPAKRYYWYRRSWRPLTLWVDTLRVRGGSPILDTVRFTHHGPVFFREGRAFALRWTALEIRGLLRALWGFNGARSWAEFEAAQRFWDAPAQNILYADRHGHIALRSVGRIPVRRNGHGWGVLDGTTDSTEWTGWIPFEALPASINPPHGWLVSANQEPAPPDYPYYLGYHWPNPFRALRIREQLESLSRASVEDFRRMQADVTVWLFRRLRPWIGDAAAEGAWPDSARAQAVRMLLNWNGVAGLDQPEPLLFWLFWSLLRDRVWDELPPEAPRPRDAVLLHLLEQNPQSPWFDRQDTPGRERAQDLVRQALHAALDTLVRRYGPDLQGWTWGKHHRFVFAHITRSPALRVLGRGPYPAPGFWDTVWPAGDLETVHSASWRMVVDFGFGSPRGYGVLPGGPSGNPFSPYYDLDIGLWQSGRLRPLLRPARPEALPPRERQAVWTLRPRG